MNVVCSRFTPPPPKKGGKTDQIPIRVVFAETGYEKQENMCVRVCVLACVYVVSKVNSASQHTKRPFWRTRRVTRPDAAVTVTERIHMSALTRLRRVIDNAAHSLPQTQPDIDG